jgi:peptidoglycan/xylan/chitin deacetylase (PgdA/CDA1 family)
MRDDATNTWDGVARPQSSRDGNSATSTPRAVPPAERVMELFRQAQAALTGMRPLEAVDILARAILIAPTIPVLRYNLGMAQQAAGLSAAAAASYKTALVLDPNSRLAMGGLSSALEELGEWDEADWMRRDAGMTLPVIHRVPAAPSDTVALTIDDGPSPDATLALLKLLDQAGVKASFFLNGQRAESHPDLVAAIAEAGHDVLNHGHTHRRLDEGGTDPIREMGDAETILERHRPTGTPNWIRLPFGTGWTDPAIHKQLESWNKDTVLVQWTRTFYEWKFTARCSTKSQIRRACRDALAEGLKTMPPPGTIFLVHDTPIGSTSPLAATTSTTLLQEFLQALAARNLRADSLSAIAAAKPH